MTYQSPHVTKDYMRHVQTNPENKKRKLRNCNPRQSKSENLAESEEDQMLGRNILQLTYENKLLRDGKAMLKPCLCGCRKFWISTSLSNKKIGKGGVREELKRLMRRDKQDWSELTLMPVSYGKPKALRKERCTAESFKPKADSRGLS